jgi:hypothetical protein
MKTSKLYYKIGAWSFALLGIVHLLAHLSMPQTAEQIILAQSMEQFKVNLFGSGTNVLDFYNGFSIIMGFALASYGLLNLFLIKYTYNPASNFRPILLLNSLVAIISCILSIQFFFIIPPIALTGIASLAFVLAYIMSYKEEQVHPVAENAS